MPKSPFLKEREAVRRLLVEARKKAGLTQQEVADRLGRPQSFVSKFERGERRLEVVDFINLCRALGVKASRLIAKVE